MGRGLHDAGKDATLALRTRMAAASGLGQNCTLVRDATLADMAAIQAIYAHQVLRGTASFEEVPPSTEELERRLKTRAQDSDEVVRARMAKAADEMSHYAEYDYIVVNRDVDRSVAEVQAILAAERLKQHRQTGLRDFVERLRRRG